MIESTGFEANDEYGTTCRTTCLPHTVNLDSIANGASEACGENEPRCAANAHRSGRYHFASTAPVTCLDIESLPANVDEQRAALTRELKAFQVSDSSMFIRIYKCVNV